MRIGLGRTRESPVKERGILGMQLIRTFIDGEVDSKELKKAMEITVEDVGIAD